MKTKLYSVFRSATLTVLLLAGNMAKATDITPGYYYMKGTEVSSAKGLYLRTTSADLPRMIAHEMPATPTMDEKPYIWKVEALNDGNFSIQNITDGYYLGGQEGNFAHHGSLAAAPHAIKFTYFDTFNNGFAQMDKAIVEGDIHGYVSGNVKIQELLGKEIQFRTPEEFDDLMLSDENFKL